MYLLIARFRKDSDQYARTFSGVLEPTAYLLSIEAWLEARAENCRRHFIWIPLGFSSERGN